jgi:2-polyprenyl-3-methyl-5-hydroxy-6-metoxy-1,4-benzoquinol methylase
MDPSSPHAKDVWASGEAYDPYIGRWSRLVASNFLGWLAVPTGQDWLDVGCGTGALTQTILQKMAPRSVKGVDAAEGFLAHARATTSDPRADFRLGDAQALPVKTSAYDAVVSGLLERRRGARSGCRRAGRRPALSH